MTCPIGGERGQPQYLTASTAAVTVYPDFYQTGRTPTRLVDLDRMAVAADAHAKTDWATDRLRVRELDDDEGQRLVRIVRLDGVGELPQMVLLSLCDTHANGRLAARGHYEHGVEVGEWEFWKADGSPDAR
jgi:hypothetical protein